MDGLTVTEPSSTIYDGRRRRFRETMQPQEGITIVRKTPRSGAFAPNPCVDVPSLGTSYSLSVWASSATRCPDQVQHDFRRVPSCTVGAT
jgi:hypothetical protein